MDVNISMELNVGAVPGIRGGHAPRATCPHTPLSRPVKIHRTSSFETSLREIRNITGPLKYTEPEPRFPDGPKYENCEHLPSALRYWSAFTASPALHCGPHRTPPYAIHCMRFGASHVGTAFHRHHPARDAAAAASAFALTFCFVHACTLMSPMGARGGGLFSCHLLCASVHMYDLLSVGGPWPY